MQTELTLLSVILTLKPVVDNKGLSFGISDLFANPVFKH